MIIVPLRDRLGLPHWTLQNLGPKLDPASVASEIVIAKVRGIAGRVEQAAHEKSNVGNMRYK